MINKVTTGTYNLVSVILNVAFGGALNSTTAGSASGSAACVIILVKTQLSGYVKITFISQLFDCISKVLHKLPKYFNGTINSTSFVLL